MSFEMKRDVLIHFNEATNEVVIFNVASSETSNIREQEFPASRFKIDWLKSKDPDEAEKLIGSMVFSTIDTFSDKQIKIRDYKHLIEVENEQSIAELEIEASSGSDEAKYHLAIMYHSDAILHSDRTKLERAEVLLKESASLGYPDAIEFLENDWLTLKNAAIRRIGKNAKS